MPQMAPMWWLTLMIYFTMIFLCTNMINYFYFTPQIKFLTHSIKNFYLNWKL
uniref:ATP synthase F0 subunit 8 n=1 Tax=Prionoglaris stygia TaxID=1954335 RepID=A0A343QCC5_9NEOP|nr:ATP synthase F0 subunit 8 [Prionoglaris stygia]ATU07072.1 ATP synthase F0 subunit 8 [Prionoglaris stygia]